VLPSVITDCAADEIHARIGVTLCGGAVTSSLVGLAFVGWLSLAGFRWAGFRWAGQARMPRRV
jgi:hypothetical protein